LRIRELLVVHDLKQDPRFENSPMVALDPPCRFYCGMPLITDDGHALGTLCVMDFEPRQLSFEQTESLRRLSHQVLAQLELRRKLIEYGQTIRELDQARLEAASEKARAEELLRNVLPAPIADELKHSGRVQPRYTRSATILFADIQGFTLLAERTEPARLVNLLDAYFTALDEIGARHGLEKVKTMGDAYMAVAGVLSPDRRHAIDVCLAALEMRTRLDYLKARCEATGEDALHLRIGIHTGPVISGVVGNRRMTFDIWGDAVNTAWFMEASGVAGRINVSETVAGHVHGLFELEPRGRIEAKHERTHEMFFLNGLKQEYSRGGESHLPNDSFVAEYSRLGGSRLTATS
jgi:adenylate cyclase